MIIWQANKNQRNFTIGSSQDGKLYSRMAVIFDTSVVQYIIYSILCSRLWDYLRVQSSNAVNSGHPLSWIVLINSAILVSLGLVLFFQSFQAVWNIRNWWSGCRTFRSMKSAGISSQWNLRESFVLKTFLVTDVKSDILLNVGKTPFVPRFPKVICSISDCLVRGPRSWKLIATKAHYISNHLIAQNIFGFWIKSVLNRIS